MQAVDILRDDRLELALTLQLRQAQVGAVGPGPVNDELATPVAQERPGMFARTARGEVIGIDPVNTR